MRVLDDITVKSFFISFFIAFFILIFSIFLGLSVGSSTINLFEVFNLIFNPGSVTKLSASIILNIRLPRILMAFLVGSALSLGGLVFQVLLKNPLAEPYILGISGGSAVGAILGILFGFSFFPGVTIMAFFGGMITVIFLSWLALKYLLLNKNSLVLVGVMINSFCSAIIMFFMSVIHDSRLHNVIFWLMGDFSMVKFDGLGILSILLIICFVILFGCSNWMNLLQLGDDMAQSMGIHVKFANIILLFFASFMVSLTVSYCGIIGFVGLVVPHILRLLISNDYRILVPACIICGGTYVIICDVIARVILRYGEMPTGVITAVIGSPLFIYLLTVRYKS